MATIDLKALTCHEARGAYDRPYVRLVIDGNETRLYHLGKMDEGDVTDIDLQQDFDESIRVELHNAQRSRRTQIGQSFTISPGQVSEGDLWFGAEIGRRRAQGYSMTYEVDDGSRAPEAYGLNLTSLECNDAQESKDEVYIVVNDRIVWGTRDMRTNDVLGVEHAPLVVRRLLRVDVWEQDRSHSDHIGVLRRDLRGDDIVPGVQEPHRMVADDHIPGSATYTLRYELHVLP